MFINEEKCIGCELCLKYCPVGAISIVKSKKNKKLAIINQEECVECSACLRSEVCKQSAIYEKTLRYPRTLRKGFSDPASYTPVVEGLGRGTTEMKTNDVTNRIANGMAGVAVELGRPGIGTKLSEVSKVANAVASFDVIFEPQNPVYALMSDTTTGTLRDEVLEEKVLSAIVEFTLPIFKLESCLKKIIEISPKIETVYTLAVSSKLNINGEVPSAIITAIQNVGISARNNGKTNLGLGRKEEIKR